MKNIKKNRWSSYEPTRPSNVVKLRASSTGLKLTFLDERGRQQGVDFSFMSERPQLASLFAQVMRVEGEKYAPMTRRSFLTAAKLFNAFLNLRHPDVSHASALTHDLLQEWAVWLTENRKLSVASAADNFSKLRSLLKATRAMYPDALRPDFDIPIYAVSKTVSRGNDNRILSEEILQRVSDAAWKEVNEIRKAYRDGDVPEGLAPLIPFMILIGLKTAINPLSLYYIGRDCLKPHVIDSAAFHVVWSKRRSKAGIQRQLHRVDPQGRGVIELLRFLIVYTEPLVAQARELERGMLFLYRYAAGHGRWAVVAVPHRSITREMRNFCERNNLPAITIAQLRPSTATYFYMKTGGKLRKVQLLLGHVNMHVTERYIGNSLVRRLHDNVIRTAQNAMMTRVATVIPKEAERALIDLAGELPPEQREKIADGLYDTGLGKCRNPYDSPQPGQHKGKCCSLFLACLSCPNAMFFLEDLPRVIALRDHLVAEKQNMRRRVWETLYQDKVRIIENDIIDAFSQSQITEAEGLAKKIADVPLVTVKGVLE